VVNFPIFYSTHRACAAGLAVKNAILPEIIILFDYGQKLIFSGRIFFKDSNGAAYWSAFLASSSDS
jgi:hypothetical protein